MLLPNEKAVLEVIESWPGILQVELISHLGLCKRTVHSMIERLLEKNLIERRQIYVVDSMGRRHLAKGFYRKKTAD